MDDKKLKKTCTILMVVNIFLTFCVFGMPKIYENKQHFYFDNTFPISHTQQIRLNADIHTENEAGEEIVIEAGSEHKAIIDDERAIVFASEDDDIEVYYIQLADLDYEDITNDYYEEAIKHNEQVKAEAPRKYMLYRLSNIFWFVVPSMDWVIEYPCGIVGGLIAFAIEKQRFKRLDMTDELKRFVTTDIVIAIVIITITALYQLFPLTCR